MFIVDFDDTLLNTHAYKQARIAALEKIGVPKEAYLETYKAAWASYTHERHAELLAERGYPYEKIVVILEECLERVREFVFPDAIPFLQFLQSYKLPLILLSIGIPSLQERRLKISGVHDYFDRVFVVPEAKEKIVGELEPIANGNWWLFNDRVEQTLEIKQLFPSLKAVLKQSPAFPTAEYEASGLPYFKTLTEIQKYVEHNR